MHRQKEIGGMKLKRRLEHRRIRVGGPIILAATADAGNWNLSQEVYQRDVHLACAALICGRAWEVPTHQRRRVECKANDCQLPFLASSSGPEGRRYEPGYSNCPRQREQCLSVATTSEPSID